MKNGLELIADERDRQILKEGWTSEHDEQHVNNELALAAVCYALPDTNREMQQTYLGEIPWLFPFDPTWWKPCREDRVKELVKAGALIAAEIDRIQATS